MIFSSWSDLLRIVVVGTGAYVGLIVLLRISGKRALSKMNAFDFVVTVALGSVLATVLLSKDIALAEGIVAFILLLGLQFIVTALSVRSQRFQSIVKSEPTLLFYHGHFVETAMMSERITRDEVRAAVRSQNISEMTNVEAVVLETDGSLSVIQWHDGSDETALEGLRNPPSNEL